MSLMYVPPYENPWMRMLPNLISSLALQKISQNFQSKQAEIERTKAEEKELRAYQAAGYKESEAHKPDIEVAGKGLMAPEQIIEWKDVGDGTIVPVISQKKYGEEKTTPQKLGTAIKSQTPYKVGTVKEFKMGDKSRYGIYTGQPSDQFGGLPGWRATNIEAPRYKPETNINIDMTKKTQADLEEKIVQGKETIAKLERVKNLYRPEFLEYVGKGKAYAQNVASKMGMKTGEYLKQYSKWKSEVDAHTFMWRKFITGVAGGEREMEAIERTTINTKYDSPAQFEAKIQQIEIMTNAQIKRAQELLKIGFDIRKASPQQREEISRKFPLEDYGYKDIDIPGNQNKPSEYEPGAIYEDASGRQMRFEGYDKQGKPIWSQP